MRVCSFGAGVQSTAVLVLAAEGRVQYDAFVFANVGEDSENPDTLRYFREFTQPYAEQHGLNLVEVSGGRNGKEPSLYQMIWKDKRWCPLPVFGSISGAPMRRRCTSDFKIIPIAKWAKRQGVKEMVCGLGISTDEIHRARVMEPRKVAGVLQYVEYPLIDLRISRNECSNIITQAGLPAPPRSSCYFCPFHSPAAWIRLKEKHPDSFERAVEMEKEIQRQFAARNHEGTYYLHRACKPLEIAVGNQATFFNELEMCESGYCFT